MDSKVRPPATAIGRSVHGMPEQSSSDAPVPTPSCPMLFKPQQNAAPPTVTPQVAAPLPVVMSLNRCPPLTSVGTERWVLVPSPSMPAPFAPQQ
jgi:hypothetical protein